MDSAELYLYLYEDSLLKRKGGLFVDSRDGDGRKILDLKEGHKLSISEVGLDGEMFQLNGTINGPNGEVGWIDIRFPISIDLASEIIETYTKKINRIKTILQAVDKS